MAIEHEDDPKFNYMAEDDAHRPLMRALKPAPNRLCLLEHIELPENDDTTAVLEVDTSGKNIVSLMQHHDLPGCKRITEQTRLNVAVLAETRAILAFSIATPVAETRARLDWIYVHPHERGKGYGRQLFNKVLLQLREYILFGTIVDKSGRMEAMAKKAGARKAEGQMWELEIH